MSHCPAMRSESRRAWSPGSPPTPASQPLPQRPFEKVPHPLPQTLGPLGEIVLGAKALVGCPQDPRLGREGASLLLQRL